MTSQVRYLLASLFPTILHCLTLPGLPQHLSALNLIEQNQRGSQEDLKSSLRDVQRSSITLQYRGFSSHVVTKDLYSGGQKIAVQITACVLAAVSLSSSLIVLYWFLRMTKQFRHKLVIILISADVIRSFWLFVFPLVSIAVGSIPSSSKFCQASGFFTQLGIEAADFAILIIATHTAFQVFKPRLDLSNSEETGLFVYRHKVYAFYAVVPPVLSSLAYIGSSNEGYVSTVVVCTLPIRPFWYRLAISWIPRYLIMLTVAALYLAVYIHVVAQFRLIGWLGHVPSNSTLEDSITRDGPNSRGSLSETGNFAASPAVELSSRVDGCIDYVAESRYNRLHQNMALNQSHVLDPATPRNIRTARAGKNHLSKDMHERHSATQRQLRYLFIYPICYFLIWLIPFVNHLTTYDNYTAQNPVFPLVLLSFASISAMGAVDSLIFGLREKPWRSIPNADGTFWGSFCFWSSSPKNPNKSLNTPLVRQVPNDFVTRRQIAKPEYFAGTVNNFQTCELRRSFDLPNPRYTRPDFQRSASTPPSLSRETYWFDRRLSAAAIATYIDGVRSTTLLYQ